MKQPNKHVSAILLVLLLVLVGPSTYVQSRTVSYGPGTFQPAQNETFVDTNISSIQVPANHTIIDGHITVELSGSPLTKTGLTLERLFPTLGPMELITKPHRLLTEVNSRSRPIHPSDH